MARDYLLTNDPVDLKRIKKMMTSVIRESGDTRKAALKAYDYFKDIVDREPGTDTDECKKCMVGCLKIASDSRATSVKLFDLLVKTFSKPDIAKGKEGSGSVSLDDILGDE
jgi:hypothetical protein